MFHYVFCRIFKVILLTKTTAAQNEVALSHHRVRRLYFLADVFATTMVKSAFFLDEDHHKTKLHKLY